MGLKSFSQDQKDAGMSEKHAKYYNMPQTRANFCVWAFSVASAS